MEKKGVFFSCLILLCSFSISMAATIDLPRTGQTKCYDGQGVEISCTGTGQDGDIQAGVTWPASRFSVGTDCINDTLTGLMWARNGNLAGDTMTWLEALAYVEALGLCGYTDWRLPNTNEMESLSYAGEGDPRVWLAAQGFTDVLRPYADYWSSTTAAYSLTRAWATQIENNGLPLTLPKNNSLYGRVLPVRGNTNPPAALWETGQVDCYDNAGAPVSCSGTGQDGEYQAGVAWPAPRFTDHGNGTVSDELTGLMWTANANAPGPAACNPGGYKTWEGGFDYVKCLNTRAYLGYSDWRIPNIKEIRSLVDYSQSNPALPVGHPFTNVQLEYGYRSSTTATYSPGLENYSWGLDISDGTIVFAWKGNGVYIWPVRGGVVAPSSFTLMVNRAGTGTGGVTSTPLGINCGTDCAETYTTATLLTLSAEPNPGSIFTGWSGAGCSGTGNLRGNSCRKCDQ